MLRLHVIETLIHTPIHVIEAMIHVIEAMIHVIEALIDVDQVLIPRLFRISQPLIDAVVALIGQRIRIDKLFSHMDESASSMRLTNSPNCTILTNSSAIDSLPFQRQPALTLRGVRLPQFSLASRCRQACRQAVP